MKGFVETIESVDQLAQILAARPSDPEILSAALSRIDELRNDLRTANCTESQRAWIGNPDTFLKDLQSQVRIQLDNPGTNYEAAIKKLCGTLRAWVPGARSV